MTKFQDIAHSSGRVWLYATPDTYMPPLTVGVRIAPARRDGSCRIQFFPEGRDISSVPINGHRVEGLIRRGKWFQGVISAAQRILITGTG